ncbi:MAG: hypothetical protein EZS28_032454 [Streblomastix strix]|uniref:Right handed beta helix domain-containing protein n=1 Tax=Streblomastix strix TaxID=222440 RepID=A0A5J4UNH2_9EUKA|nr:MAG: hypothetical protein EZS28_032454 [Streblomastix strix]
MKEGLFISHGIDVVQKHLILQGYSQTEIALVGEQHSLFSGNSANISLHNIRFPINNRYNIARIDKDSYLIFKDNTISTTAVVGNCFEIDGGSLLITNLKLDFKTVGERRVFNLIKFGELGGYLQVHKTYIEGITVGGKPLFGDERATGISIRKCQFKHVQIDKSNISNNVDTIVGSTNINITRCTFIDVDNALIGGIINGLNWNGKLSVIGSNFKNCHNFDVTIGISMSASHTDITSGDVKFKDDTFEDSSSTGYGGAIRFVSNGELKIEDCKFIGCNSLGKGGAIFTQGNGFHNLQDLKFDSCSVSENEIADGGSLYIDGGENLLEDISISNSQAKIVVVLDSDSVSRGGAIFIINWGYDSEIKNLEIDRCSADAGGAIYIESTSERLEIKKSRFSNNKANSGGGGSIYASIPQLIYLRKDEFLSSSVLIANKGSDLHFGDIGVDTEVINWIEIKENAVDESVSNSSEPRVCIETQGCQEGWLLEYKKLPGWATALVVLFSVVLTAATVILVMCCVWRCRKNTKVSNISTSGQDDTNIKVSNNSTSGQDNTNIQVNVEEGRQIGANANKFNINPFPSQQQRNICPPISTALLFEQQLQQQQIQQNNLQQPSNKCPQYQANLEIDDLPQ